MASDHQGAPQQGEPEPGGETTRRRRIRSAVRQLSFEAGGEDATLSRHRVAAPFPPHLVTLRRKLSRRWQREG
eukprot:COSAG04_NODE_26870_length_289_cov_1.094737_1_plen_72_part_10